MWRVGGSWLCLLRVELNQGSRIQSSGRARKDLTRSVSLPARICGWGLGKSSAVAWGVSGAGLLLSPDGVASGAQPFAVCFQVGGEDAYLSLRERGEDWAVFEVEALGVGNAGFPGGECFGVLASHPARCKRAEKGSDRLRRRCHNDRWWVI